MNAPQIAEPIPDSVLDNDLSAFVESTELALQDLRRQLSKERDDHKRAVESWAKERAELLQGLKRAGEFSHRLPTSGKKVAVKCDDPDVYNEFGAEIEKQLEGMIRMVPDSRPEYEGRGYSVPSETSYAVDLDVTDCQVIAMFVGNCTVEGGGCDTDHGGPCSHQCDSWEFGFSARLSTVWSKTGRTYARYSVELEA